MTPELRATTIVRAALTTAFACTLGSCIIPQPPRSMPVAAWFAEDLDIAPVRRVMVLPLRVEPGVTADEPMIRQAFTNEMQKIGRFEILGMPTEANEDELLAAAVKRGEVDIDALVALGSRYRIDGVILGSITGYRPYQPPRLGLRVELVSLHSGSPVWSSNATYDTVDARVQEDLQHYARSQMAPEPTMHEWRISMLSPNKFATFVSHRLAGTWRQVSRSKS